MVRSRGNLAVKILRISLYICTYERIYVNWRYILYYITKFEKKTTYFLELKF